MEHLRSERLRACGRLIQKMVRGWLARQHYIKLQRTVRLVQKFGRGMMARRSVDWRSALAVYLEHSVFVVVICLSHPARWHQPRLQCVGVVEMTVKFGHRAEVECVTLFGYRCSRIFIVGHFFQHVPQWPCPIRKWFYSDTIGAWKGGNQEVGLWGVDHHIACF